MSSPEPIKFLIVDDLETNRIALEALLRRDGLELHMASSGAEALELLLRHDFALLLLDVQMPEMDGFELAEILRGTERTSAIPIIFLTAVATDEHRRFRGYETGAVDYLLKPVDPLMLRTKANVFYELGRQRQDLARQRDELRRSADLLSVALERLQAHRDNSPLAVVEFDAEQRIAIWSKGAERMFGFPARDMIGRPLAETGWISNADAAAIAGMATELAASRSPRVVHHAAAQRADGTRAECEWCLSVLLDRNGQTASLNAQILDITERRHAEDTQRLLIGELNHRVKNTLATVQAIATQTLRHAADGAEFASTFSSRIQALSRAHSLLSSCGWHGASVSDLIDDQLRLGAFDPERMSAFGPDVMLPPQLALHLAMIVHELGTNATKYGAFSCESGRVDISWRVEDGRLAFDWLESGAPAPKAFSRRGFGTTLVEQGARAEGGDARLSIGPSGISWHIRLPLPRDATPATLQPQPKTEEPPQAEPPARAGRRLAGCRFVVIEDEPLVALELASVLEDAGAQIVGHAGTCAQALEIIESVPLDGAFLDGNLRGEPVGEVAEALARRKVPFLFVSGYDRANLPSAFGSVAVLQKPFLHHDLLDAAAQLFPRARGVA
jgi:PAS domain S-box-containing protein